LFIVLLKLFLIAEVIWLLSRKNLNKYLYLYLTKSVNSPETLPSNSENRPPFCALS